MYPEFIARLKEEISNGLPGWKAQKRMAPSGREQSHYNSVSRGQSRESGVLIWLYPDSNKIYMRLIIRTEGGIHSKQAAFPGGKFEQADGDFWHTALREAYEEIGLQPEKIRKVGPLTPLYIPPSNFWVHPFIGTSERVEEAKISAAEVQTYFDADIMLLLEPSVKQEKIIKRSTGEETGTPFYNLEGHTVWGATAMILSELEELVRRIMQRKG